MKIKVKVLLIALAAIVFVFGDAQAASWYVDNAVASSGNGQSWATAFKNSSNIVWSNVHAGDVIYISGGPSGGTQTYTESWFIVGASGAAGNPIIIAVDSTNASHNGTVGILHRRIMWQEMQEFHWAVISPPIRTVSPAHRVLHGI
jgi:hypothetical protein